MIKQTKLVDCGSTVFVYDFQSRGMGTKELGFEQDAEGNITRIKRLLLTNFVNDSLPATFRLKISLNKYEQVQERVDLFVNHLKKSSGHRDIKYLAVTQPSSDKNEEYAYIHLVTNIEIDELTIALDYDISEEEQYFEDIWGDELFIDVYSQEDQLETFTSAYEEALKNNILSKYPKSFYNKLKRPSILWNEEAEDFIKKHNLMDYPKHRSDEIYDKVAGFININEYSLYDTSSFSEEVDMNFF